MRKIQYILYVAFVALFFTACQEDDFGGAEQGGIRIALADGTTGVDVTTRSTPSELFDGFKKKFKFQIKGGDNYDQTHEWTENVIPLAAGVYEILATCGTEQAAGVVEFDKPCYTGKAEGIKVEVGKEAKAEVKCKVTNALVSIKFAEGYETYAENAYAMIAVGSGIETNWAELSESAYFKAGSSLTKLVLYKNGSESLPADILTEAKKVSGFPETFKAGDHLILTLSVAKKNGNVSFKVSKVELKEVTIEETIPMEWLPKPKMEVDGFTGNQLVMYESETPTAKFNFNLYSGLQELKFTLDFDDETYQSLNKEYVLSTLSESDKQALTGAGVVLPSIGDKGNVSLDFSGLAAKLTGSTEGGALDNVIKLTEVKANNRVLEGGEQTYTIQTHAPEFGIKVYPGNTWTKQFTANTEITKGNAEVIREGMTFEYSTNGSNWISSKDSLIAGLTPGTDYQVRAKFGKHVTEVVNAKTYPVIELENGGLEEAEIVRGSDDAGFFKPKDYGAQYEWPNWATLNALSAGYSWKTAYSFNSRSGTRPTSDKPEGVDGNAAVRIITLAYGGGGTDSDPKSFTHSELFLGEFIEEGSIKNYGISYTSRPTGIRFFYKCISNMNNDVSEVKIQIYNDQILLGEGIFQTGAKDSYADKTLYIDYKNDMNSLLLEPNRLSVVFKSGVKENLSKSDLKQFGSGVTNSQEDPMWRGNELFIDDVSLVYDK